MADAEDYNARLREHAFSMVIRKDMSEEYLNMLDPSGSGMMGYIKIPAINVELPVYHGMDEAVLAEDAGHISGSSLPTGGIGNHTVIVGHTGLASAKLFTELDELEEGDRFYIYVLDRELIYEVDQINVVRPEDTALLEPVADQDLCTLITCTPYGVNSHRLLVRGKRVYEDELAEDAGADKIVDIFLTSAIAAAVIAVIIAGPAALMLLFGKRVRRKELSDPEGCDETSGFK